MRRRVSFAYHLAAIGRATRATLPGAFQCRTRVWHVCGCARDVSFGMSRLIIVSNRLPVSIEWKKGGFVFRESAGGLASGLRSFYESMDATWIGSVDMPRAHSSSEEREEVRASLAEEFNCHPVFLTQAEVRDYYAGFSNRTIWPMFHQFSQFAVFEPRMFSAYMRVNNRFCDAVDEIATADDAIWIHDYHLLPLPELLRKRRPGAEIGFFLHIPFPPFEIFRALPWREELIRGMLGADLVGFHTYDYMSHFLECVTRFEGYDNVFGRIECPSRVVQAEVFPMGIDYERFSAASQQLATRRQAARIHRRAGDRRVILSMDRLDYTKGILERLRAFDAYLERHPEQAGKLKFLLVAVPSRTRVESYRELKREVDELVGRINGRWGSMDSTPVGYLYQSLPFSEIVGLYDTADVALVTPLRDGMNLIAKEYVATKCDNPGVLILSEMAGAAAELGEAIIVNPNDQDALVKALEDALALDETERAERSAHMCRRLKSYDIVRWANDFLSGLSAIKETQRAREARSLDSTSRRAMLDAYARARRRLLLLDYDGTLMPFRARVDRVAPDHEVRELLRALASDRRNRVVVLSGRIREQLEKWLGDLDVSLVAEHGAWMRNSHGEWTALDDWQAAWKEEVRPILERYVTRVPGSFIEEKSFSLAWHYRAAESVLASARAAELQDALTKLTSSLDATVTQGSKVLEVRTSHIHKGRGVKVWLDRGPWDFVFEIGDDRTDEDGFAALPEDAFALKVGTAPSIAPRYVRGVSEARSLVREMADER
jgi:trehalose 6-phosphate synthase/phosphatase